MSFHRIFGVWSLASAALVGLTLMVGTAHASDFSFNVHNSTDTRITKILVSENRKSWGQFNIGRGIQPQWVKAVFADNTEAKPAKFDFCEDDLEIEF